MWGKKAVARRFLWRRFRGPARSGRFRTEAARDHAGAADGKELFYFDLNGIAAAEVNGAGPAFEVGSSKLLFRLPLRGIVGREYSPTRDGQRFIAVMPSEGSSQQLTLVQNWPAELKK